MDKVRDIAEFRSPRFAPVLPEDCQVNPECYGAELAFWLCLELAKRGIATSYPLSEDWGWFIEFITDNDSEFAVYCANVGGAKDHWLLSLRRYGRKLFGGDKPPFQEASALIEGIRVILRSEPSVSELRWLYEAEAI